MKSTGMINLRVVKCILTGPPGAGKSTLKKRLLNETLVNPSFSTGIASAAIPVDSFRKIEKESAVVSGLDKNPSEWRKHNVDEEAAFIFEKISLAPCISKDTNNSSLSICMSERGLSVEKICDDKHQNSVTEQRKFIHKNDDPQEETLTRKQMDDSSNCPGIKMLSPKEMEIHNVSDFNEVMPPDDKIESDEEDELIQKNSKHTSNEKAIQFLSEAVKTIPLIKRIECDRRSKQICESSHAVLHVHDTGGQPEFHEILPVLITGPAINLVVFKLTEDLRNRFMITYRSPTGGSLPYKTSFTHEEVIFRSLASMACLRQSTIGWTFDEFPVKDDSEPAAFLIATHRDCVDESKVAEVNEQLKVKIQNSDDLFYTNLVQFSGKDQAVFALDTINDQENIEHLRTTLHNVISKKFQELIIPVSWCTFNLKLHKSKKPLHKLNTCYKLAKDCGISDKDDFKSALWFLHHRVGSIMHYPEVKGLEDIVITDLQLLFDRITQLIASSFTYEFSGSAAIETKFRTTGKFTESYLKTLSTRRGDPLTHLRLVTLLKHLHIVAGPIEAKLAHKSENIYFMPCALKPTTVELEHKDKFMFPAPLIIYFKCGYNPVGAFCCLVVHLLSSTTKSELKWILAKSPHYRNKITFYVGKCYDQITLVSRVTYLEVWVYRMPGVVGGIPLEELCPKIYSTLDISLKIVTESLHYTNKSHHSFGFRCTCATCQSSPPHPAICEYDDPVVAKCVDRRWGMPLLKQHKIWYKKKATVSANIEQENHNIVLSRSGNKRQCSDSVQLDEVSLPRKQLYIHVSSEEEDTKTDEYGVNKEGTLFYNGRQNEKIGDKRVREDVDSDYSYDEDMLEKSGNISSSLTKKQKKTREQIGTSLSSENARKALVQFTDAIVESNIDYSALVRKLYSKEVVSETVYKRVRDRVCRDTREERLENILDEVQDHIKNNASVFRTFLDTLNDLNQKDLTNKIEGKYKELERSMQ